LMEKETLHKEEIEKIFVDVVASPSRPAWTGSSNRVPSKIPPVEIPKREEVEKPRRRKKST